MKNKIIFIALTFLVLSNKHLYSQGKIDSPKKAGFKEFVPLRFSLDKISPSTGMFLLEYNNSEIEKSSLYKKYGVKNINGLFYIGVFIQSGNFQNDTLDFLEGSRFSNIITGLIRVDQLSALYKKENIEYVQIGTKASLFLDEARKVTKVDEVHNGTNLDRQYKGKGVVVGVIDQGFDYTHPSFYDSSYTFYRVKRVWEQTSNSGTPPQGFSYGKELIGETQILNAQGDNFQNESHGTHVAGTAAGSGPNTNNLYTGVAPKADLVLVSTDITSTSVADGVNYIFNYASSVNKPCVINMSLGTKLGPKDGNSTLDKIFDNITGSGKILVGAAGNYGKDSIHIKKTFTSNDTILYAFFKFPNSSLKTDGTALLDIWGTPNKEFWTAVNIINTQTNSFEDWTQYISSNSNSIHTETIQDNDIFSDDLDVIIGASIFPNNNKANVQVSIDNTDQDDNYRWAAIEIIAYSGTIDIWLATPGLLTSNNYNYPFENGQTTSTIAEFGGTGKNVITVGAYTSKNQYTNYSNQTYNVPSFSQVGEIAPFSSLGPTSDNRTKPDITAPGNILIAPVNSFDINFSSTSQRTIASNSNNSKTWYYGAIEGTSMASPMVTGIIALWLERNPNLTPNEIKDIVKEKSDEDSFTGFIPSAGNNTWGWGKINAHEGMKKIVGLKELGNSKNKLLIYPNPSQGLFYVDFPKTAKGEFFKLYSPIGNLLNVKLIKSAKEEINLEGFPKGIYILELENSGQKSKLILH